jgi:hypothetical protein
MPFPYSGLGMCKLRGKNRKQGKEECCQAIIYATKSHRENPPFRGIRPAQKKAGLPCNQSGGYIQQPGQLMLSLRILRNRGNPATPSLPPPLRRPTPQEDKSRRLSVPGSLRVWLTFLYKAVRRNKVKNKIQPSMGGWVVGRGLGSNGTRNRLKDWRRDVTP